MSSGWERLWRDDEVRKRWAEGREGKWRQRAARRAVWQLSEGARPL